MVKTGKDSPYFIDHTGATNVAKNGMKITVVAYRLWNDIDVLFEDGTLVTHKTYRHFTLGNIRHPDPEKRARKKAVPKHIGESNTARNGMQMTIITYRRAIDIDIQFEDGYISKDKMYSSFINGYISHKWPYIIGNIQLEKIAYKYNNEINYEYICKKCHHHDIGTLDEMKNHKCEGDISND